MILYPIFYECQQYVTSHFWKKIFDDLSHGITPKGIYIDSDRIWSTSRNKSFSINYKDLPSEDLSEEITDKFTKYGILQNNTVKLQKLNIPSHWKDIKKKNIRESLLLKYISDNYSQYSPRKLREVYFKINCGLAFKLLTSDDIKIKDNRIVSINGFS